MEQYGPYGAILVACILFFTQTRQFAKPEDLERKHLEILKDCDNRFATLASLEDLKQRFGSIEKKIDDMIHILTEKGEKQR